MTIKQKITERVLDEDKELEERLKAVRSRVLGTKDLDLIESYFDDLRVLIGKYEQEKEGYRTEEGRLSREFFADLTSERIMQLQGKIIHRTSEAGKQQGVIEEVRYMQKPRIPNYEPGMIYIMPYKRKITSNLFNIATGEDNAVVWVRKVRIDGKLYGPGQFTNKMNIGLEFDKQSIEDSNVWIG